LNHFRLRSAVITLAVALGACADTGTTSSVEGTVAASSFATTPQSLTATDETGATTEISLLPTGSFFSKLQSGHTYSLTVNTAGGSVPLLFPRVNGALDATFTVASADAVVELGEIQALNSMPSTGITVLGQALTITTDADAGAILDDTQTTVCLPGHEHSGDGGCPGMHGANHHRPEHRGGPFADGGFEKPAQGDPKKPFCFPQHAPPPNVDCRR
jgi:hypothetical protein